MDFNKILELNELAKSTIKKFNKKRFAFNNILAEKGKHFVGIVGPRGVGKTVILKQILADIENSFYVSADTIDEDIFEIAKILKEKFKIKLLLIDEIHFKDDFEIALKKIYDFLNLKVIFTSSCSLSLFQSAVDLSRRVKLIKLYPFSLREYLYFKKDLHLNKLTFENIIKGNNLEKYLLYEFLFDNYLKGELFPFSLDEPEVMDILKNILNTIIFKDIPSISNLKYKELNIIEKVIKFIGKSPVDGINFSSVAKNLGITKYKAEQYIKLLENSFILNIVYPAGSNVLKEPKILMNLPFRLIFKDFNDCIGELREDFFVEILKMQDYEFYYLKTNRGQKTPDYIVKFKDNDVVFEIGGRGKGKSQFKGVKVENKIILTHPGIVDKNKLPLFIMGFTV